jgi:exosome complex component RRP40
MEPELECFDAQTRKAAEFGELKGGFMVRCSLQMCRQCVPYPQLPSCGASLLMLPHRLLDPHHFLLPFLGSRFPLEVAVGTNGRVWISSNETKPIIAIARCIEAVDLDGGGLDESGVKTFFNTLDL